MTDPSLHHSVPVARHRPRKPSVPVPVPPWAAAALVAFLMSCGSDRGLDPGLGDHIVAGVDFAELFAAPGPAELKTVRTDWHTRDTSAQSYRLEASALTQVGATALEVSVISHTVTGERHFGAVTVPAGRRGESLPVLVYSHFSDAGVSVNVALLLLGAVPGLVDNFVCVIPSFRSRNLIFAGTTYPSEGDPSPWDDQIDDGLALLNTVLERIDEADEHRIAATGLSNGATASLLMAVRDPRVDVVVDFFGPVDFLGNFAQEVFEQALLGDLPAQPGIDWLAQHLVVPLRDGLLTVDQVRLELIRRSPVYFADRLPALQIHHGTDDLVVPLAESCRLEQVTSALGLAPEFFVYPDGGHHPLTLPQSLARMSRFLDPLRTPVLAELGPPSASGE